MKQLDLFKDLHRIDDMQDDDFEKIAKDICDEYPSYVADYRYHPKESVGFLLGIVMKEKRGAINPRLVKEALIKELNYLDYILRLS